MTVFPLYVYALWSHPQPKRFTMYVPLHMCVTINFLNLNLRRVALSHINKKYFFLFINQSGPSNKTNLIWDQSIT